MRPGSNSAHLWNVRIHTSAYFSRAVTGAVGNGVKVASDRVNDENECSHGQRHFVLENTHSKVRAFGELSSIKVNLKDCK